MNPNGENNEVSEQNLEQVAGGDNRRYVTGLYRCPACQHEEKLTSFLALPDGSKCPCCGATMKLVPSSVTGTDQK